MDDVFRTLGRCKIQHVKLAAVGAKQYLGIIDKPQSVMYAQVSRR